MCVEAWSYPTLGHILSFDTYDVARWDEYEITAESDGLCAKGTLKVSFQAQTVYHLAMPRTVAGCLWPGEKSSTDVSRLVDGWDYSEKQYETEAAAASDARRRIIRTPQAIR